MINIFVIRSITELNLSAIECVGVYSIDSWLCRPALTIFGAQLFQRKVYWAALWRLSPLHSFHWDPPTKLYEKGAFAEATIWWSPNCVAMRFCRIKFLFGSTKQNFQLAVVVVKWWSVVAFYSDNPSSNPLKSSIFLCERTIVNKKVAGVGPFKTKQNWHFYKNASQNRRLMIAHENASFFCKTHHKVDSWSRAKMPQFFCKTHHKVD